MCEKNILTSIYKYINIDAICTDRYLVAFITLWSDLPLFALLPMFVFGVNLFSTDV